MEFHGFWHSGQNVWGSVERAILGMPGIPEVFSKDSTGIPEVIGPFQGICKNFRQ
jgi:hypothetical protein